MGSDVSQHNAEQCGCFSKYKTDDFASRAPFSISSFSVSLLDTTSTSGADDAVALARLWPTVRLKSCLATRGRDASESSIWAPFANNLRHSEKLRGKRPKPRHQWSNKKQSPYTLQITTTPGPPANLALAGSEAHMACMEGTQKCCLVPPEPLVNPDDKSMNQSDQPNHLGKIKNRAQMPGISNSLDPWQQRLAPFSFRR